MSEKNDEKQKELDRREQENKEIKETGEVTLDQNRRNHKIELLTIIGEVEGHDAAPSQSKTTKYEHVLPKLAMIEDDEEIEGLLILLNTVGGDVEAGLAIAEMIASLSVPTVSLGARRRAFHRRSDGSICGLFFCRAECDDGHPSGPLQRHVHRRCPDVPQYGKDPGPYHQFYRFTFQSVTETPRRADAGYQPACKRCGNTSGRGGSCEGRPDR